MKKKLHLAVPLIFLALASPTFAQEGKQPIRITEVFKRDHPDDPAKEILVKRIELDPGAAAPPHVHPGMVTGHVIAGRVDFQLKDQPLLNLKTGDTFFEPPGSHHMVARNPDDKETAVIIAFVVNPKGAPLSTPIEGHKGGH